MSGSSIVPSTWRVAREDLLEQRRSGARQPDDEDRIRGRGARRFPRREEIRVKCCLLRLTKRLFSSAL
jgi:hypothetical protein